MSALSVGCAVLVFAVAVYRLGFQYWAEHPRVTVPRPEGAPLTVYEVAALYARELHPDHLARTVLSGMVLSGALQPDGSGRLRVGPGAKNVDAVQAAVLAVLDPAIGHRPSELCDRVAELEEVRAVDRELGAAGLVTRSESEAPVNVSIGVMVIIGPLGALTLMATHSPHAVGVYAGLLAVGGGVALAAPERYDRASRRGRRLLAEVGTEPGRRPILAPGLVLDDASHAALARMALHYTPVTGLSVDAFSGSGGHGKGDGNGPVIGEGPGLGGL
ncbi:hypothetical protein F4556_007370 [Kitasatospora gansuensis]|uniref:Uncharacterized protein n=1 Tax=Kitasatospora gansuensis TaxID=258050 RepID=A0A7W7SJY2_9ACTN|nr:hypothetical protein [Kitasatospora gansuensis]MBB4951835.1 hypothetical protein [Kitasatospora gansuensis]